MHFLFYCLCTVWFYILKKYIKSNDIIPWSIIHLNLCIYYTHYSILINKTNIEMYKILTKKVHTQGLVNFAILYLKKFNVFFPAHYKSFIHQWGTCILLYSLCMLHDLLCYLLYTTDLYMNKNSYYEDIWFFFYF